MKNIFDLYGERFAKYIEDSNAYSEFALLNSKPILEDLALERIRINNVSVLLSNLQESKNNLDEVIKKISEYSKLTINQVKHYFPKILNSLTGDNYYFVTIKIGVNEYYALSIYKNDEIKQLNQDKINESYYDGSIVILGKNEINNGYISLLSLNRDNMTFMDIQEKNCQNNFVCNSLNEMIKNYVNFKSLNPEITFEQFFKEISHSIMPIYDYGIEYLENEDYYHIQDSNTNASRRKSKFYSKNQRKSILHTQAIRKLEKLPKKYQKQDK